MGQWARSWAGGSFLRPVLTLVSGGALAHALVFTARPALTRLFTPEEFGVLTLFVAIAALVGAVTTGRYEDALMLPDQDDEAAGLLWIACLAALGGALVAGVMVLAPSSWAQWLNSPSLITVLALLPSPSSATALVEPWQHGTLVKIALL